MSVQFQTQRDAKTGKGNVIETLDIDIADEVAPAPTKCTAAARRSG